MKVVLKLIIGSLLFFGILPMLLLWKDNLAVQGIIFIASLLCYGIAELIAANANKKRKVELCALANALFLAILFLALAAITNLYFDGEWVQTMQIGFVMLSAVYYSFTFLQFVSLGRTAR